MKRERWMLFSGAASAVIVWSLAACAQAQNLVANGDFSAQKLGAQVSINSSAGGEVHDRDVFSSWRFFSVGNPSMSNFTATIVANTHSAGNLAMRLDYANPEGLTAIDWGLDRWNSRMPVSYGTGYTISFDAAHISGSTTLAFAVNEFVAGAFSGCALNTDVTVSDAKDRHYVFQYTPSSPAVTSIDLRFKPKDTGDQRTMSLTLDNVQIVPQSVLNGSFEAQAAGTQSSSGGGDIVDGSTFSYWRFFSVGTPAGSVSTATIVSETTDNNVGIR